MEELTTSTTGTGEVTSLTHTESLGINTEQFSIVFENDNVFIDDNKKEEPQEEKLHSDEYINTRLNKLKLAYEIKPMYKWFVEMIDILDFMYPDNWDIFIGSETEDICNPDYEDWNEDDEGNIRNSDGDILDGIPDEYITSDITYVSLILKYDEITIKNSAGLSHIINNLFVSIKLYEYIVENDEEHYPFLIQGLRTKFSTLEYNNHYVHSHLPNYDGLYFNLFCLGSSEINHVIGRLKIDNFNKDLMMLFFHNLNSYLGWESLEGGPYKYITDIYKNKALNLHNASINPTIIPSVKPLFYNNINVNLHINSNKYDIDIQFDEKLVEELLNRKAYTYLCTKNNNGQLVSFTYNPVSSNPGFIDKSYYFTFKDKLYYLEVYEYKNEDEEDIMKNREFYINPNLINSLKNEINEEYYRKKIRDYHIGKQN